MTFLDPRLIAGTLGLVAGLICWLALRKHGLVVEKSQAELRSELQAILREQAVECSGQIAQLARNITVLELSARNVNDAAKSGLMRSVRSQAMQLLRSGMSPESAASTLGLSRREMRLIARVSRTLSFK